MKRESKILLAVIASAVLSTVLAGVFAPTEDDTDPRPSSYNAGPAGAKAAFLLLPTLGYRVERFEKPLVQLDRGNAAHQTLIMANPWGSSDTPQERDALAEFIEAGGRVLGMGESGMIDLPGVYWETERARSSSCSTTPEGLSALAAVGSIALHPAVVAQGDLLQTEVAQRCPDGAAVIEYAWGAGRVVWWTDPAPLTNKGLHNDRNLALFLASVGDRNRTVLFDEANIDLAPPHSIWSGTEGLPMRALAWQLLLGGLLLVLSFSRRHGPRRTLTTTPRTSPLEFAYSMGNLYYRGRAGEAATAEARDRLLRVIERQCGLSRDIIDAGPAAIADELRDRLNFRSDDLIPLLERTAPGQRILPGQALTDVQRLNSIADQLRAAVSRLQTSSPQEKTLV